MTARLLEIALPVTSSHLAIYRALCICMIMLM